MKRMLLTAIAFCRAICGCSQPDAVSNVVPVHLQNAVEEMLVQIEPPSADQKSDFVQDLLQKRTSDNPTVANILIGQTLNTASYASPNPKYSQAIGAYKKSLQLDPSADAFVGLGRVYYNVTMDYGRSRIKSEAPPNPADVKRIVLGLRATVMALKHGLALERNLGTFDTSKAATFKDEVAIVLDCVESENIQALRLRPSSAVRHFIEGVALHAVDSGLAREKYLEALHVSPDYPEAYFNLGGTYYDEKRYEDAAREWVKGISLMENEISEKDIPVGIVRNDLSRTCFDLGSAFFLMGQYAKAKEYWAKALDVKPDYWQAKRNLESLRKEHPELW